MGFSLTYKFFLPAVGNLFESLKFQTELKGQIILPSNYPDVRIFTKLYKLRKISVLFFLVFRKLIVKYFINFDQTVTMASRKA